MAENGNGNGYLSPWARDIVQILVALAALVTAIAGLFQSHTNSERIDRHGEQIVENKDKIVKAEQAADVAKIAVAKQATAIKSLESMAIDH